jgi:hypothetical protein
METEGSFRLDENQRRPVDPTFSYAARIWTTAFIERPFRLLQPVVIAMQGDNPCR